jgi:hypothetical protein
VAALAVDPATQWASGDGSNEHRTVIGIVVVGRRHVLGLV